MPVTRADILARCPELTGIPDGAQWDAAIADATMQTDLDVWGNRQAQGIIFLAAHGLAVNYPGLVKGPLQSVAVGGVSKTMAVFTRAASIDDLTSTKFGLRYLALVNALPTARLPGPI
jgi:hypothetical protein